MAAADRHRGGCNCKPRRRQRRRWRQPSNGSMQQAAGIPAAGIPAMAACRQQAAGSKQQEVECWQQGAGSGQQAGAGSKQPNNGRSGRLSGSREHGSRQQAASSKQQAAECRQQGAGSGQQAAAGNCKQEPPAML